MTRKRNFFPNGFDLDLSPFHAFIDRMDSVFNDSFKQMNSMFDLKPFWVEVEETADYFIITADLEDVNQEQINIDVTGNRLLISVDTGMTHPETASQQMTRMVRVPFSIPRAKTKARFNDGQLIITIAKPASAKIAIDHDQ